MRVVIPVMMALALYLVNMSPSLILISVVDGGIKCNPIATKSNIHIHTYIHTARGQSQRSEPEHTARGPSRSPSPEHKYSQSARCRRSGECEPEHKNIHTITNVANGFVDS